MAESIDCGLGSRTRDGKGYNWSEVVSALWSAALSGGDFLEDVNETGKTLRLAQDARVPGADTVGRAIKELATDSIEYTSKAGNTYSFNPCEKLNALLLDVTMQLGLLKGCQTVDVDFYHVFTPCKKADARYSYKKDFGYFPGVYSVSGLIAGVENRDGNTPVTFCQGDTHLRFFARLRERNIGVDMFRADCGSYTEDAVRSVYLNCRRFYMKENAVFMVLSPECKNFYTYLIAKIAALFFGLKPTSRLKSFVYRFITVPARWTRKSRSWHLNFYTDRQRKSCGIKDYHWTEGHDTEQHPFMQKARHTPTC